MAEMMGMDPEMMSEDMAPPMYVMSNESKINGAAAMIFTEKLQEFADAHETNLFILPSSIHEILLIPESAEMNVQDLKSRFVRIRIISSEGTSIPSTSNTLLILTFISLGSTELPTEHSS